MGSSGSGGQSSSQSGSFRSYARGSRGSSIRGRATGRKTGTRTPKRKGVYGGTAHLGPLEPLVIFAPPINDPGPLVVSGCPGIGGIWKGRYDREPIAKIRPLLGVITGDLEAAFSSAFIRSSYALVFRFLAEAGTLRRLDGLLAAAGTGSNQPEWQLDVLDWMKKEIETSGETYEPVAHLEWAKDLLQLGPLGAPGC